MVAHAPIILALHKARRGRRWDHTNIQPSRLTSILSALSDRGYRYTDLQGVVQETDPKQIALTFDDGYALLAETIPPICEQFRAKPTLFIPAGYAGKSNRWDYSGRFAPEQHLSQSQIRSLAEAGFEIGSHGWSHAPLTQFSNARVAEELGNSKRLLEEITGSSVRSISYPFGRFDQRIVEQARMAGYTTGVTTSWISRGADFLALGRIIIYGFDTPFSVLQKLEGRLAWLEKLKQSVATSLSGGTGLYQRISGHTSGDRI